LRCRVENGGIAEGGSRQTYLMREEMKKELGLAEEKTA
jgi:hypothetical protein